jgi:hypothetical protein
MWRHVTLGLALWWAGTGCAYLEVKKVSEDRRAAGCDNVKGFRYYLARPYVVVKAPILVSESSTLYVVTDRSTPAPLADLAAPPGVERVSRVNPASGAFESVSEAEVAALRRLAPEPQTVRQVAFRKGAVETAAVSPPPPPGGLERLLTADAAAAAADVAAGGDVTTGGAVEMTDRLADAGGGSGPAPLNPPTVTPDNRPLTPPLVGDIQIFFLPDMDEQYAIHNCNVLSKSGYQLLFKDGWQLTDVSGEFDSTPVPLAILNFIDNAINAAKQVAIAGIDRQARILGGDVGTKAPKIAASRTVYQVITSTYLKPGVYRINKPWECNQEHATGCGLLAAMGLATYETTRVEVNPTLRTLSEIKQDLTKK